jgi:hypothetical protein
MLRPRLLLHSGILGLALFPCAGWSSDAALDDVQARAKALVARHQRNDVPEADIRNVESGFISLMRQHPDDGEIAKALASFYQDRFFNRNAPDPALLDLVRTARDPVGLIRVFIRPQRESPSPLYAPIAVAALFTRPMDAGLWDLAAMVSPDAAWEIAFQEEAFRLQLADSPDAAETGAMAARWLGRLLEKGLLHRALAVYRELPPAIRVSVDNRSSVPSGQFDSFLRIGRDLRLELAVAAFLDGDRETAARFLQVSARDTAARNPRTDNEKEEWDARLRLQRLVERALSSPPDDGFDLLLEPVTSDSRHWVSAEWLLAARLAEREGYPALAAHQLDRVANLVRALSEPFEAAVDDVPVRVRTSRDGLEAERQSLVRSLQDEARSAEAAASTALGSDPMAPVVARLLAAPIAPVFSERPLPKGIEPLHPSEAQAEAKLKAEAEDAHLPSDLNVVRVGRNGQRIAAIVQSQGLDPVGELSAGAYWVLLSEDGGATWGPPLYTGLRINQPYVLRPVSALPLFDRDHLRLEVEIRELDPELISFPPIDLPVKRSAEGLFLDLPLATLARDRDDDGLTDLAEARLLTDPTLADTDGDGLADGDDPLPGIAQKADASSAAQALAAVLENIAGVGRRALIAGVDGTPAGVVCCGQRKGPPVIEPTVFFIGERPLFGGLSPDQRVVVLTQEEADAATKAFGPFYPLKIELFFFDHSGHRGLVIWSASWQGGTLRLEEKDGQWTIEEVSRWFT